MSSGTKSDEVSGDPEESCVYDFLYYDARRIGSFQAQLGNYGAPGKISHRLQTSEGSSDGADSRLRGGLPAVVSGEAGAQSQHRIESSESLDSEYDPFWINGLNLHDDLSARKLIKNDIQAAQIGDFVDVQGALSVIDFTMFQSLWSKPSIQSLVGLGAAAQSQSPVGLGKHLNKSARERQLTPHPVAAFIGDILSAIPHRVQARMLTEARQTVFANLTTAGLVIDASDVLLKHGLAVDGRWRMFGLLDALPDSSSLDPLKAELIANFAILPFGQAAAGLLPLLQTGYARPPAAWGVTPIMVFREVSAR